MTVTVPALSGSESVVGMTREATWGTTPVSGSNPDKVISRADAGSLVYPAYFPIKEENIQAGFNAEPQTDDMSGNREISRVIENGPVNQGSLRFIPGPETLGILLTAMFGTPATTLLAASSGTDDAAYQHIWYPGQRTRALWPAFFSIESIFAATRSKLARGAVISRLPIEIPNNGPLMVTPEFLCKNLIWLGTAAGSMGSGTTNDLSETRPAVMTASPTLLDETPWHFKHIDSSDVPEVDDVDELSIESISIEPAFVGLEGLFLGGSGLDLGTFRVDNFQLSGRASLLFADEAYWEKFKTGGFFKFRAQLKGDLIQGTTYNLFEVIAYSCKATTNDNVNRVGNLTYDFAWSARKDPTEGKSCQFRIINTVAQYD